MKINRIGTWFVFAGILMILAATLLFAKNIKEQMDAAANASNILSQMEKTKAENCENTDINMPVKEIDREEYVGIITIPSLDIQLPIINEWSYKRLKKSPCRYSGSAYLDDLIIMAHNYSTHFGKIGNLKQNDKIYFESISGNVFTYKVVETETLGKKDVDKMKSGDWDLTLFTCTLGGKTRVTVRCERIID